MFLCVTARVCRTVCPCVTHWMRLLTHLHGPPKHLEPSAGQWLSHLCAHHQKGRKQPACPGVGVHPRHRRGLLRLQGRDVSLGIPVQYSPQAYTVPPGDHPPHSPRPHPQAPHTVGVGWGREVGLTGFPAPCPLSPRILRHRTLPSIQPETGQGWEPQSLSLTPQEGGTCPGWRGGGWTSVSLWLLCSET